MLHAISWQQYIAAVILLTLAWYIYVGLTFYRAELRALLGIHSAGLMPPVAATPLRAVIGSIQPDIGTEVPDADELIFSPGEPDDISEATLPKGPSDDLLAEATTLAQASGTKADFLSLLQVLLDKHELYRDEISLPAFTAELLTLPLPFELTENDLDLHWPAENYA